MKEPFRHLAENAAHAVGSYWAFLIALLTIVVWALTGPYFNYSDTWQLFINTGTTIVTFVFLIQNTQNRETRIVALKLDELLRGVEGARTGLNSITCRTTTLSSFGRNSPGCVTSTHLLSTMILPMSNAN